MLTHYDVENLNRAMGNMGQAITEGRRDRLRERHETADEQFRQKMAQVAEERAQAAQSHWQKMEGAQANAATKQQQAAELKDKQEFLQTLMKMNASGQLGDLDSVNNWLSNDEHFGKVGLQLKPPAQKPPPHAGQNSMAAALEQAGKYQQIENDPSSTPEQQAKAREYRELLEKSVRNQATPKPDPTQFRSVTDVLPGKEAVPPTAPKKGKFHLFGANEPDTPGTPGTPAIPERRVTYKEPIGAPPAATQPITPTQPTQTIPMRDPSGNLVKVPIARREELLSKGYTPQ